MGIYIISENFEKCESEMGIYNIFIYMPIPPCSRTAGSAVGSTTGAEAGLQPNRNPRREGITLLPCSFREQSGSLQSVEQELRWSLGQ